MNNSFGYISLNNFPRDVPHSRADGSFGCLGLRIPSLLVYRRACFETSSILCTTFYSDCVSA